VTRLVAYVTTFPHPISEPDLCPPVYHLPSPSPNLFISLFRFLHLTYHAIRCWRRRDLQKSVSLATEPQLSHLTPLSDPDLIRHGKAHQGQRQGGPEVDFVSPEHQQPHQQQRQHRAVPPKERNPPEAHKHHNEPKDHMKTADYSREAEIIVKEERQAKSNVPQYKGLERYRILEKMGESVTTS